MGSQGHSCLLLVVEIMEWSLVLFSDSEYVLLVCDGEEHGLSVDMLIVGDEGLGSVCVSSSGVVFRGPIQCHKVCKQLVYA